MQLQKSAVLQKTIDYIRHLENMVRRLSEENEQLKEARANGEHCPACMYGIYYESAVPISLCTFAMHVYLCDIVHLLSPQASLECRATAVLQPPLTPAPSPRKVAMTRRETLDILHLLTSSSL